MCAHRRAPDGPAATLARTIVGGASFNALAPVPFGSAPQVPREALLLCQELGAVRLPMSAAAVPTEVGDDDEFDTSSDDEVPTR